MTKKELISKQNFQ